MAVKLTRESVGLVDAVSSDTYTLYTDGLCRWRAGPDISVLRNTISSDSPMLRSAGLKLLDDPSDRTEEVRSIIFSNSSTFP